MVNKLFQKLVDRNPEAAKILFFGVHHVFFGFLGLVHSAALAVCLFGLKTSLPYGVVLSFVVAVFPVWIWGLWQRKCDPDWFVPTKYKGQMLEVEYFPSWFRPWK
ncbi:hypothetical protein [uncultured Pseudodesulfovibrio sp.]|uniref:hypothetical protein n=1 Tax=uncultured Pseudodesulfovibrio sp. TaxID=2035858 RepID=UPI0029C7ABC4|nr:hypothetical protein [uncultured Pseudodesulfovibrio sp.]